MAISVREAGAQDFAPAAALLAELGRPAVLGTPGEAGHRRRFEAWLADPDRFVFLAVEDDGAVVGLADLWLLARLNFETGQAWVPDLVVTEAARSRGAGAALLGRCEAVARERGAWGIRLESANWRERAHAFYLREGYTATGKSFDKLLADIDWPPRPGPR